MTTNRLQGETSHPLPPCKHPSKPITSPDVKIDESREKIATNRRQRSKRGETPAQLPGKPYLCNVKRSES